MAALKLDVLAKTPGEQSFEVPFPPHGERKRVPSVVAAVAQIVRWRCGELHALDEAGAPDLLRRRAAAPGARCDVRGRGAEDRRRRNAFVDGGCPQSRLGRGFRARFEGDHIARRTSRGPIQCGSPATIRARSMDSCGMLSLDMRVLDPAWIGMKLRKLLDYSEPLGDFLAFVPGERPAADMVLDGGLPRAPRHSPLRDARCARRAGLSHARNGYPRSAARGGRPEAHARGAVQ